METFVRKFEEIGKADAAVVGGKNASLGEMFTQLSSKGVPVPDGFATTATAFWMFIDQNDLRQRLQQLMDQLDKKDFTNLKETGKQARQWIMEARMPEEISAAIISAYKALCGEHYFEVAVRSSATAEDLPQASFAGQHETYLNIKGEKALLEAVQRCFASLYTDRAIKYREDNKFAHEKVALSAGIQKMVRSDLACAGVGFTLEPESGFRDIIHLSGVWGLGENIVQGNAIPDEFFVFKPALRNGKKAVIQKKLGEKAKTMVYATEEDAASPTVNTDTPAEKRSAFILNDDEIMKIASWALFIEEHYQQPMDIEWAKDGNTGGLFIVQARPETVHTKKDPYRFTAYRLLEKGEQLASGEAIGTKIATGVARVLQSSKESDKLQPGEIVVTDITSPDWDPILKKAAAMISGMLRSREKPP